MFDPILVVFMWVPVTLTLATVITFVVLSNVRPAPHVVPPPWPPEGASCPWPRQPPATRRTTAADVMGHAAADFGLGHGRAAKPLTWGSAARSALYLVAFYALLAAALLAFTPGHGGGRDLGDPPCPLSYYQC